MPSRLWEKKGGAVFASLELHLDHQQLLLINKDLVSHQLENTAFPERGNAVSEREQGVLHT